VALSFRARIVWGYLIQLAAILVLFSAALYVVLRWRLTEELDASLEEQLRYIATRLKVDDGDEIEFIYHEDEYPPDLLWQVALADGTVLARSRAHPDLDLKTLASESAAAYADESSDPLTFLDRRSMAGEPLRIAARQLSLGERPRRVEVEWKAHEETRIIEEKPPKPASRTFDVVLLAGRSLASRNESLLALTTILGIAIPATLAISLLSGLRLARKAIAPVERLSATAERIGPGNLSGRLPVGPESDEIARLAGVMNDMLRRIEEGFERERRFTSDASHELRSPLTALRGDLEVALRRERTAPEYRDTIARCLEDVRRVERLVAGLLVLARLDGAPLGEGLPIVDLRDALSAALPSLRHDGYAESAVRIDVASTSDKPLVAAEPELIEMLIRNLLENALKHGAPPVRVEIQTPSDVVELTVSDEGPGLPTSELERIFDRFYRVDRARSRATGGIGLGLAICQSIALAHGGSIRAQNDPKGGARFTVTLPRARSRLAFREVKASAV